MTGEISGGPCSGEGIAVKDSQKIGDVLCAGCGCGCDDVMLEIRHDEPSGQPMPCELSCRLGQDWLSPVAESEAVARINGAEATLDAAIDRAVQLLKASTSPAVYGLTYASCEAQKAAIDLAEAVRGTLDVAGAGRDLEGTAIQNLGAVTATFGELRDRADFILLWNASPDATNPRFLERYLPGKTYFLIADAENHPASAAAARTIILKNGADAGAVSVLRSLLKGQPPDAQETLGATGVELAQWQALLEQMKAARYGAVILPPRSTASMSRQFDLPLTQLVRELNRDTRFVACRLTAGNAAGAIQSLVARTGFPCCVNFERGFPRFDPLQFALPRLLESGETDLVVFVGDDPSGRLSAEAIKALSALPTIYVDSRPTSFHTQATVSFLTARPGVQSGGTFFRADGIALPLRQLIATKRASDEGILKRLTGAVRSD